MEQNHTYTLSERDRLTAYFLPENAILCKWFKREKMDSILKTVTGMDEIVRDVPWRRGDDWKEEERRFDTYIKQDDFNKVNFRYARVFELCRILGAANLYDIGCQTINQSFMLVNYSTVSYTGIMNSRFVLNDYRDSDFNDLNSDYVFMEQAPEPFCGGRIRFIRGHYPDVVPEIEPNNIAIACYSITMCRDEESINEMAAALTRDFERVLFNIPYDVPELVELWKKTDWQGFEIYPIGPEGFLFATKHPEDIRRMKETYPFIDGRFMTGIDNMLQKTAADSFERYADWSREI